MPVNEEGKIADGLTAHSEPVEQFRLAYERTGSGTSVVALHGWPADRHDWRGVAAALDGRANLITVDLRGFGESDSHAVGPSAYTPGAQAESILALIDELQLGPVVLAGYDLGSMVAEQVVRMRPEAVAAAVLAPPLPGLGDRLADPRSVRERWYIAFHQSGLATDLVDGNPAAVRTYLSYFWSRWSGPDFQLEDQELDRLTERLSRPGAFAASVQVYRSGRPPVDAGPLPVPTTVVWPDSDPLFPVEWVDDLAQVWPEAEVTVAAGSGHFAPREAPDLFGLAILRHIDRQPRN